MQTQKIQTLYSKAPGQRNVAEGGNVMDVTGITFLWAVATSLGSYGAVGLHAAPLKPRAYTALQPDPQ